MNTAKKVSMAEGGPTGSLVRDYYLWTEGVVEEIASVQAGNGLSPEPLPRLSVELPQLAWATLPRGRDDRSTLMTNSFVALSWHHVTGRSWRFCRV